MVVRITFWPLLYLFRATNGGSASAGSDLQCGLRSSARRSSRVRGLPGQGNCWLARFETLGKAQCNPTFKSHARLGVFRLREAAGTRIKKGRPSVFRPEPRTIPVGPLRTSIIQKKLFPTQLHNSTPSPSPVCLHIFLSFLSVSPHLCPTSLS